jgi:hypothetical protein
MGAKQSDKVSIGSVTKTIAEVLDMADAALATPQPPQAGASARITLEGFRVRLLTPVVLARDENGWFVHPEYPACDADMRIDKFLDAFGIEPAFVSMEDDAPEFSNRWAEEGLTNCSEWTPTPPEGNGWALLAICDSEDGPYAIFGRDAYAAEQERKKERTRKLRVEITAAPAPAEPKGEQLDMSLEAQLADAKADVARLHSEKMALLEKYEYTPKAEQRAARLSQEMHESVRYAAEWLARSEDIANRKHSERLLALLVANNGGSNE